MKIEELDEILETYKWIKVNKFDEYDLSNPMVGWKSAYKDLLSHHEKETTFLISKCRELAEELKNK